MDTCGDTGCAYSEISGCCTNNDACFDGNECTWDLCVDQGCQHLTLCCESDSDCTNTDSLCTTVSCDNNLCSWTYVDESGCCKESVWNETFEGSNPLSDWTLVSDNDPQDEIKWQVVTGLLSSSHPGALYYGNSQALTYDSGEAGNIAEIATPSIKLPSVGHIELAFQLYLANEYAAGTYPNPDWDRLTVWLYPSQAMPILLWDSGWGEPIWWTESPEGEPLSAIWTKIDKLMLSDYADQFIQLGFRFDTKDGSNNDHLGVLIDDLSITTTCSP